MSIDVSSLIAKVIERTGQKCGQILPPAALGTAGPHGEELLVESLSTQLLTFLGVGAGGVSEQKIGHFYEQGQFSAELNERNRNVTRALGACECWGEFRDCNVCHGRGRPGWTLPYKPLFDRIVRPSLDAVRQHRSTVYKTEARASRTKEENMDALDFEEIEEADDLFDEESIYGGDEEAARLPTYGLAARRRFARRRRPPLLREPQRKYLPQVMPPRQAAVTQVQLARTVQNISEDVKKLMAATRTLEGRLDLTTRTLAEFQNVRTGQHSAELLRYALTNSITQATPNIMNNDFGGALVQTAPLIQAAFSETGRAGLATAFSASPVMTVAFPLLAGAAVFLLRKPNPPVITQSKGEDVEITAEVGMTIRATKDDSEPTKTSDEITRFKFKGSGTAKDEVKANDIAQSKGVQLVWYCQ